MATINSRGVVPPFTSAMTDLVFLFDPGGDASPAADHVRETVRSETATVVALQIPTIQDGTLDPAEFVSCYHQQGIDLASIGEAFRLRDIILVTTPNDRSPLNVVFLHVWTWPASTYDIDAVRIPHQGDTDPRNNPEGKNPGNIWAFSEPLNDRKPGTQSRLIDPDPPETVADGHLEVDAIERLLACHTNAGDTVHIWTAPADAAVVSRVVEDLDRTPTGVPAGDGDPDRTIPVVTEDFPIERAEDDPELDALDGTIEVTEGTATYRICDCRAGIEHLPSASVQDVVTSPPYNIAYDPFNVPKPDPETGEVRSPLREGYDDDMPAEQYHHLLQSTFDRIDDRMDPASSDVFVNIKNNYSGGDCRPPFWLLELVPEAWAFSDLLVWRYDISYDPAKNKYKPYYEWVFRFSKGDPNWPDDHAHLQDYYIPIVKGNSTEREGLVHPAIYPRGLVKTCLDISDHSGLVVDPFLGSGTTIAAATEMGRPSIGFEKNRTFESDIDTRLRRATPPAQ